MRMYALGLSPRVRGNRVASALSSRVRGSIPARAGEPLADSPPQLCHSVYPRACGGTLLAAVADAESDGLSPRVRGNLGIVVIHDEYYRSIPARAGEPWFDGSGSGLSTVYPRACGGTLLAARPGIRATGLSPRVRGNRPVAVHVAAGTGSIPARAGEPATYLRRLPSTEVYPRACGGTTRWESPTRISRGLSPRVRGNLRHRTDEIVSTGSIPARAGEPPTSRRRASGPAVYPRACGGTRITWDSTTQSEGLSPRVRGNRTGRPSRAPSTGSIPARAGEPCVSGRKFHSETVYPRACGGTHPKRVRRP